MFEEIYKKIKEYKNIVIVRHIGVDPDALCSQLALRDAIKNKFPEKEVLAIGSGSQKFIKIGKLDKNKKLDNALLIVLDTPDRKRIDGALIENYSYCIKIDHHPFIERFADIECIDDTATSACEILMRFFQEVDFEIDSNIAGYLYLGLVSDSNRFLFNSCSGDTFKLVGEYVSKYNLNLENLYPKIYMRDISEVRLEGYISLNMKITDNGVGYIYISDDTQREFNVDSAAAGNMINHFNYIESVPIWLTITEDVRNKVYRISVRSREYTINTICEKYNGGGHKNASGARVKDLNAAYKLIDELDILLKENKDDN